MTQTRFFVEAQGERARRLFAALETAFEEDAWPLAMVELDEAGDRHEISVYAEGDLEAIAGRITKVTEGIGADAALGRETLPDIDWVAASLEGLKPVRVGRFLVHGAHDRGRRRVGDVAIEIEAGLAFGTGHHATTSGCLEMLATVVRQERPRNALDLGAGSAVLAIALAKLRRIPVLATDIDPVANEVARANVRLNHASAFVSSHTARGFHHPVFRQRGPFDLIVANILAGPLMQLAPDMARHLRPGGSLILSGVLARQRRAVLAAYSAARFRHVRTLVRDGWVTLHLKR